MKWFIVVGILMNCVPVASFVSRCQPPSEYLCLKLSATGNAGSSYEELLRQAMERRQQKVPQNVPQQVATQQIPTRVPAQKASTKAATSTPIPAKDQQTKKGPSNGLPFDDDTYKHMKLVIEKLTARIKSETPLTIDEFKKFEVAVKGIIRDTGIVSNEADSYDSNQEDQERTNIKPQTRKEEITSQMSNTPKTPSAFDAFRGAKSTWDVPNMEKMTTEEYYNALNQRLADVREQLKADGMLDSWKGQGYLDKLNERRQDHQ